MSSPAAARVVPAVGGRGDPPQDAGRLAHELTAARSWCARREAVRRSAPRPRSHRGVLARLVDDRRERRRGRPRAPPRATRARPSAIACTSEVADHGRLLRPGEHGPAGRVRRPLAEQRVARAAADDVDDLGGARRSPRRAARRTRVLEREALEHAADDLARRLGRRLAASRRRTRGSARACRRAPRSAGRPGRSASAAAARRSASATSSSKRAVVALERPARAGTRAGARGPVTFRSSRIVPATPPSFVRLAANVAVVDHGRVELEPDERPGAGADVGRAGPRNGHGGDGRRRCRASPARSRDVPARPVSSATRREQRAERACRARRPRGRRRAGMPSRSSTSPAQAPVRGSSTGSWSRSSARRQLAAEPVVRAGRGSAAMRSAAVERGSASAASAASSKTVLIGISWMPVRS